jgi:hypothetical protein
MRKHLFYALAHQYTHSEGAYKGLHPLMQGLAPNLPKRIGWRQNHYQNTNHTNIFFRGGSFPFRLCS